MDANVQGANVRGGGKSKGQMSRGWDIRGQMSRADVRGAHVRGANVWRGEMSGGKCPRITPTSAIIIDTEHDTNMFGFFLLTNVNIHF